VVLVNLGLLLRPSSRLRSAMGAAVAAIARLHALAAIHDAVAVLVLAAIAHFACLMLGVVHSRHRRLGLLGLLVVLMLRHRSRLCSSRHGECRRDCDKHDLHFKALLRQFD
jgi:hypothetical protein